jgi:hypothetical protein
LAGKTPSVQGFVVIFTACSAHAGSHSRSLLSATAHGLAWSLPEAFAVSSPVAIFFAPFSLSLAMGEFLLHWMKQPSQVMEFFVQSFQHPSPSLKNSPFYPLKLSTQASNREDIARHKGLEKVMSQRMSTQLPLQHFPRSRQLCGAKKMP